MAFRKVQKSLAPMAAPAAGPSAQSAPATVESNSIMDFETPAARRSNLVTITLIASMFALIPGAAQSISINLVAGGTTPIPAGTGTFAAFSPSPTTPPDPCISSGNIAFCGIGSGGQEGIYASLAGTLTKIADLNTPVPGGTGNFVAAPPDPCISGSNVAFTAQGSGQQGVYATFNGVLTKIADTNTPIPASSTNFTAFGRSCISGSNVVFSGQGSGQQGVYASLNGTLTTIADLNTPIPGGTGNFVATPVDPCISGSNVAFIGQGANNFSGVYASFGQGLVKLADTSTPAPGGGGLFFLFENVAMDGTNVAFTGSFSPDLGGQGIYLATPDGALTVVADTNTPVPGGVGNFTGFGNISIDPNNVVFEGFSFGSFGIYGFINGSLIKIADLNDTIGGKALSDLNFGLNAFSGGQIVFDADFTDGSHGIATATINGNRCPVTAGFWKNHASAWPATSLVLGSQTYSQSELLDILNSGGSDASVTLARQLIATKLDIASGSNPAPINSAVASADNLLSGFAGKLPYNVKGSSSTGQSMTSTAATLQSYTTGAMTPGCTQ